MYNLTEDEVLLVDGGGDGGYNHGEIIGGAVTCGVVGLAYSTFSPPVGLIAGVACSIAGAYVSGNGNTNNGSSCTNHNSRGYHGHAGGMDGSSSGFGR